MKKKRLLSIICASALLTMYTGGYIPTIPAVSSTSVTASAAEDISEVKEGPLTFRVYSDYAEVSECARSCKGVIVIPDEINGVPVMSIGGLAFSECEQITSVIIPDSVFKIGYCSFSSCKELATVKIPDSVSVIGSNAFNDTKWLTAKREEDPLVIVNGILIDGKTCSGDVIIPDSVTGINDNAFTACKEITSVVIPDSVKKIGYEAFAHCTNLIIWSSDSSQV